MKKLLAQIVVFVSVMSAVVGISSVVASAAVYRLRDGITIGQVMQNDTYLGTGDYFTVVTGGNAMTIDMNTRSYIYDQETGDITHLPLASAYRYRLKTSGIGDIARRNISFTTSGAATLEIYAVNGSSAEDQKNRSLIVADSDGNIIKQGLCRGSNTELYEGKNVGIARKETVDIPEAGTYHVYCAEGSFSIYDLVVTDENVTEPLYWAESKQVTFPNTAAYPTPYGLIQITNGNIVNNVLNAVNNGGNTSNSSRIRLGAAVHGSENTAPATIKSCGYITFEYAGDFKLNVLAASSGASSTREIFLGTYENGEFTDITSGIASGNVGTNIVYSVKGDGTNKTYALYVKPYYKDDDDVLDPYDNTDIRSIELFDGEYYTTPAITLSEPEIQNGELVVKGSFNKFSSEAFEVNRIWVSATSGEKVSTEAVWHGDDTEENEVIYITDNGDGTASFTAYIGPAPRESVKLQAHAYYKSREDNTNVYIYDDVEVISNAVKYNYAA